jgi:hypothetical protein
MKAWAKPSIVLTVCGALGCSGQTSVGNDAAPAATPSDAAPDAEGGVPPFLRGFVGVAQTYADQKNGPVVNAYQAFFREDPCVGGDLVATSGCAVTTTPNACGGLTFSGRGYLGRVFADDLVAFWWPFNGIRLPQTYFNAGDVRIQGQTTTLILPPNQTTSSEAIVAFEPLETIRVAATGDVVPPFDTEVQMPSRAFFSTPDLSSSELVLAGNPSIEVVWTADGSVGTVEVWSAFAATPDAYSEVSLVHCSAPMAAGRLTVPPLPPTGGVFTPMPGSGWAGAPSPFASKTRSFCRSMAGRSKSLRRHSIPGPWRSLPGQRMQHRPISTAGCLRFGERRARIGVTCGFRR